jgi:nitroreductase
MDILAILKLIDKINEKSSLNIQFIKDGEEGISGFKASYGMISGVKSFIALVGNNKIENFKQKLGYYGEMIVLEATSIGLGTCWVGGTYDNKKCKSHIKFNEQDELVCIIVIGHTPKELSIKEKVVKKLNEKNKRLEDIVISNKNNICSWIEIGIKCALKSPSALNKKEISYEIYENKIKAFISSKNHGYEEIDLGISMLHFELGADSEGYKGNWHYKNGKHLFY